MPAIINNINWLDIIYIILFLGMVYKGLRVGVGGQIISLIGLAVLLFVSLHYYSFLSEGIFGFMLQKWAKPVTYFSIAAVVFVCIKMLERIFNITGGEEMAVLERIVGGVVAAVRAVLLFGMIGVLLLLIPVDYIRDSVTERSKTAMFLINTDLEVYRQMVLYSGAGKDLEKKALIRSFLDTAPLNGKKGGS